MNRLMTPFVFAIALLALPLVLESRANFSKPPVFFPESSFTRSSHANSANLILADRVEKEDSVLYGTDSDPAFSQEEQEREEKLKEEKAWQMLDNMNVYQGNGKKRPPPRPSGDKKQ